MDILFSMNCGFVTYERVISFEILHTNITMIVLRINMLRFNMFPQIVFVICCMWTVSALPPLFQSQHLGSNEKFHIWRFLFRFMSFVIMNIVRIDAFANFITYFTSIILRRNMLAFYMLVNIGFQLTLVATISAVPHSAHIVLPHLCFNQFNSFIKWNYIYFIIPWRRDMWIFKAFLVFIVSKHWLHWYRAEELMCLASIWYFTLVHLDWKPHSLHSHLPPPRLLIRASMWSRK